MPFPQRKVKVQIYGAQAKKTATLEDGATLGAVLGANLFYPDGTLVTLESLAEALEEETAPTSPVPATPSPTLWSLILGIPTNIVEAAALTGEGVVVREADGDWVTVPREPVYQLQTVASKFWLASEFVRGHNIIGVRYGGGPTDVYIPHEVPIEHVISVKDEVGNGDVTVRIY